MITRGIGAVAKGMQAMIDFEDITAHNLANVTTSGFKRSNITFQDVMQANVQMKNELGKPHNVGKISNGVRTDRTYIDFSQGGLQETGHKLDVAIEGQGFFKVRYQDLYSDEPNYEPEAYYYQRVGNFKLDDENFLVNSEGDFVMDMQNKKIRIARNLFNIEDVKKLNELDLQKNLVIGENGEISLCDENFRTNLQKIQICDFQDKTKISNIGLGKYLEIYGQDAGVYTKKDGTFSLQQGMMEMSNANTIAEMLNSINVSRSYEAMSTILKTQSDSVRNVISLGNIGG